MILFRIARPTFARLRANALRPWKGYAIAALFLSGMSVVSVAQSYPTKPVRLISPYSAGGLGDLLPRALAGSLTEQLGQTFLVDNRPGASQMIGTQLVARSTADGYTLLFGSVTSMAINVSAHRTLGYDPLKDFVPITLCFSTPLYLLIHAGLPVKSVRQLINLAKEQPNKLSFASGGRGSSNQLAGELFRSMAGIELVHVPYKGAGPAMIDVAAGQVDMMFEGSGLHYLKDSRLRVLAITSLSRSMEAPELPTMNESGVPGYESTIWFGVLAPAKTDEAVIRILSKAFNQALGESRLKQRVGFVNRVGGTPEAFAEYIRSEIPKWRRVIQEAHIVFE